MLTIRFIIQFFDKGFVLKSLFIILLISLIPLAEIVLLFRLGSSWGMYLVLSCAAATGFLGLFIIFSEAGKTIDQVKVKVKDGYYPQREFADFAGICISGLCLLSPGFITDAVGLLFLFPALRNAAGRVVTKRIPDRLKELYEYLKLYD